ncbi:hypothetical protein CFBP5875_08160 [Agrobacterium pusense]|jgi:hypothetical protein|uniref:hypothetical protein n=1 Tax=Agrobacterium pusense TaxID=648995 RepID=UPI00087F8B1C|nr:hypothetical protein [Agrobacterium pusense]TGR71285.1 hypothetical protein EN837_07625 [bacterium M00.F.Ca.ET.194.01.1.1]TGS56140.1 hypothetical protein EN822_07625 [bacterium M00.F.Ca.ET.179.01.1.1]TGV49045.1 hypothetical protein EN811_07625 [bacterium M00.F.Ca.ET.168.01.1.1]MBW9057892.1 hypothetical protein [Agrobacterium pusense]MBW9077029.1 hypothetical protein [Agrobacterium pusense]
MKPTDRNPKTSQRPKIAGSSQAAVSEIFSIMAIGMALAPTDIARTMNSAHRHALSKLLEHIENGEINEEDLQKLWLAHHASDRVALMAPLADLIRQISQYSPGREP